MSRCGASVVLVLLGVVLASGVPGVYVSKRLEQTHDAIVDLLGLKQLEVGGHLLFNSVIRSLNTSCQRSEEVRLMNATLDVYARIFSSILQGNQATLLDRVPAPQRGRAEADLKRLQHKMEELRRQLSVRMHDREDVLSKLGEIKVDDPVVQRRALAQFKEIYQVASVICYRGCGSAHPAPTE